MGTKRRARRRFDTYVINAEGTAARVATGAGLTLQSLLEPRRGQPEYPPMTSPGVGGQMGTIGPWFSAEGPRKVRTIKSAERTLALFEMFSLYQRPLGVGEISKALDIPQPSVSMLVRNLAGLGYLEHDRAART